MKVMNPLRCVQIKLYSMGSSDPGKSIFLLFSSVYVCVLEYTLEEYEKLGERGHLRDEVLCVLNPVHAQGMHLVQNQETLKHNSHERGDQSFCFLCAAFLPRPLQPAEPLMLRV